LMRY